MSFRRLSLIHVATLLCRVSLAGETSVEYTRDIRPVLSNHCFQCHGPDDEVRQAELRLDTQDGLESVLDRDDLTESEILQRILSEDPDIMMPPPATNKPLTTVQRRLLSNWIMSGGEWRQHWAFSAPKKRVPPASDSNWSRNEIDAFTLRRMRQAELKPSPEADPYTLVRRLYLDLTGLPPTPDEADTWVKRVWPPGEFSNPPESSRALCNESEWQALVTQLLNSPAWAERWARRWLDLARYADTNGYEKDRERSIWPYRDWVIQALHNGMPFDQFTVEQIAGDMLPRATIEQRVATGFHRNTMLNEEGGIDPLEFRFHAMTDRVATTGTTWLGLTLGCAQCHTHKYDPISHREYYQMMAFLNNADEPTLQLPDATHEQKARNRRQTSTQLIDELADAWPADGPDQEAAFAKWLAEEQAVAANWISLRPADVRSSLPILTIQDDDTIFASGDTAKRDEYWVALPSVPWPVTALQLEALPDDRLPAGGPGSTYYEGTIGDFFLNEFTVKTPAGAVPVEDASHSYAKDRFGQTVSAQLSVDGDVQTGWSVHGRQGERHTAIYRFEKPIPPDTLFEVHLVFGRHFASSLGRFRLQATAFSGHPQARPYRQQITKLLARPAAELTPDDEQLLLTTFLMHAPQLEEQQKKIHDLLRPVSVPTTLVMQERPPESPRATWRHHRGEYLQPKEAVTAATPEVLHPLPAGESATRLGLARWLVNPNNPLTPRVVVNRHWAAFFGTGIVRTLDDFGLQGEFPSHPHLLDWLAVTFVQDDGWSLRQLHRRIVTSSLYRQSAAVNDQAREIDPGNRLLSHSPRFRLDAEIVRDRLLVAAGVLNPQIGGPSVKPPQPDGVEEITFSGGRWKPDAGPGRYRRSLYTHSRRTAPFAMLSTFDAPSGESCVARRNRSNNPLQALTLLNDVMFTDLAGQAGRRIAADESDDDARVRRLFRQILIRPPTEQEVTSILQFIEHQRREFRSRPSDARRLAGISDDTPGEKTVEYATWTAAARALFALDETVTRE